MSPVIAAEYALPSGVGARYAAGWTDPSARTSHASYVASGTPLRVLTDTPVTDSTAWRSSASYRRVPQTLGEAPEPQTLTSVSAGLEPPRTTPTTTAAATAAPLRLAPASVNPRPAGTRSHSRRHHPDRATGPPLVASAW